MVAGLPKRLAFLLIALSLIWAAPSATAQELPESPPATAEDVAAEIAALEHLTPEQQTLLTDAFNAALDGLYLTPEEALDLLASAAFDSAEAAALSAELLDRVLQALNAGQLDPEGALTLLASALAAEDPLAAIEDALSEAAGAAGVVNAIGNAVTRAGLDEAAGGAIAERTEALLDGGVPPGIVVRVVKQALKRGASAEDVLAQMDALLAEIEAGTPPGQAANKVRGMRAETPGEETEGDATAQSSAVDEADEGSPDAPGNSGNNGNAGGNGKGQAKGKDKDKGPKK